MEYTILHSYNYIINENDIMVDKILLDNPNESHAHDFIELAYVSSGRGEHVINGKKELISKGDLYILNPNIVHSYVSEKGSPLVIYNCIFLPPSINLEVSQSNDFLNVAYRYLFYALCEDKHPTDYIKLHDIGSVEVTLNEMYRECKNRENGYLQVIRSDLIKLLILVFRIYKQNADQNKNMPVYKKLVAQNALEYLKQNYNTDIKCEALAEMFYLSPNYLSRIFKEAIGKTIIEVLQEIRMDAACEFLKTTTLSVAEIAGKVNYSDIKYFYRVFLKFKGQTPGEYRRQANAAARTITIV